VRPPLPVSLRSSARGNLNLETEIWRFLPIEAALQTLLNQRLRFTQIRKFEDQHEGAIGLASLEWRRKLESDLASDSGINFANFDEYLALQQNLNRVFNYVSSWTMNSPENFVMWKSYTTPQSGCALSSSVGLISESLLRDPLSGEIGRVDYSDPAETALKSLDMRSEIFRKRKAFEFESEVRFAIESIHEPDTKGGPLAAQPTYHFERFNPESIREIVVHPYAEPNTEKFIEKALSSLSPTISVSRPRISEKPPIESL